ncbi:MAG: hypothetical protein JXX29_14510 [Deltaproteobacteria bacterium]|nr:hypothetical protein [Deltaproteobacteria bacterium]MBN2672892.1 hypothetical protein [Deltaproteobacteria bacterium]
MARFFSHTPAVPEWADSTRRPMVSKRTRLVMRLLPFIIWTLAWSAHANLPLGGKTASMGGAGAAAGKDAAMPFINPAGYSQVPHHTLSLSASLYRMEKITVQDYFFHGNLDSAFGSLTGDPSFSNNDLTSRKFSSFPGVASALWHFGDADDENAVHHVFALSMVVQSQMNREFKGDFSLRFGPTGSVNIRSSDALTYDITEYLFGPTYAVNFGSFRLGTSIFLAYTDAVRTGDSSTTMTTPIDYLKLDTQQFFEGDVFGLQPSLGFQWAPRYGFSVGASWLAPMIPIRGTFEDTFSAQSVGPTSADNYVEEVRTDGEFFLRRPMRLRVGLAYGSPHEWSFAIDGELVFPMDEQFYQNSDVARSYQEQSYPVVLERYEEAYTASSPLGFSVHAGTEWYLNEMLALRMGGYFQKANSNLIIEDANVLALDVDHAGGTLGLGVESDIGETTFGFQFDYGFGQTTTRDAYTQLGANAYYPSDVRTVSGIFFISGTFDLEEFESILKAVRQPTLILGKERKSVTLPMVSPALSTFASDPLMQSIFTEGRFTYAQTGYEEFDDLFERIAKMNAALVVATEILQQMEAQVNSLKLQLDPQTDVTLVLNMLVRYARSGEKTAVLDTLLEKPDAARLVHLFQMAQATVETLKFFGQEASKLPKDVQRLIDKAQQDFVGPDMVLLPAVARNLGAAEKDAVEIVTQVPKLIEALGKFFAAFQNIEATASSPDRRPLQLRIKLQEISNLLSPFKNHPAVQSALQSDDAMYTVVENTIVDTAQKELVRMNILLTIGESSMHDFTQIQERLKEKMKSAKYRRAALFQLYQLATQGGTPTGLDALGTDQDIQNAIATVALLVAVDTALHEAADISTGLAAQLTSIADSPETMIADTAQIPFILPAITDTNEKFSATLNRAAAFLVKVETALKEAR